MQSKKFVIHDHYATRHHFDLRLERYRVLKSWAVPKGMPSDNVQHLAIQTPNHPMTYLRFSGTIPEKLYGAGKVTIHDIGTYDPISWSDKKIEFTLHGKLYKNITFVLIKLSQPNEWLLIKKRGI